MGPPVRGPDRDHRHSVGMAQEDSQQDPRPLTSRRNGEPSEGNHGARLETELGRNETESDRDGGIVRGWRSACGAPQWRSKSHGESLASPETRHPKTSASYYTDTRGRARVNHHDMSLQSFPADMFPIANTDLGPGCLALFLGSEPEFRQDTVWMHPCWTWTPRRAARPSDSIRETNGGGSTKRRSKRPLPLPRASTWSVCPTCTEAWTSWA